MHTLTIIPLSTPQSISAAAERALQAASALYVQTEETPCILPVRQLGVRYISMDDLYQTAEDFDALQSQIADRLFSACAAGDVAYAVPGRGMGAALAALRARASEAGIAIQSLPGAGYAEAASAAAGAAWDAIAIAAASALPELPNTSLPLCVEELDTRLRAGEVKLYLQEHYPDAHEVLFCSMEEDGAYTCTPLPLHALDRQTNFHATTVLYVPPVALLESQERFGYNDLMAIMRRLRGPGGCPWDAKQTHASLKKNLVEECYEVLDAIDKGDDDALCEELGDVLLQCVFHAIIAEEQGRFTDRDVATAIVRKLIYRHPHIFAKTHVNSAEEVLVNWEKLKKVEKHFASQSEVLQAVPKNLPALMRASKLQKKAAQVGFDWDAPLPALEKLEEEAAELRRAYAGDGDVAEELGDLLFSAVNVVRLSGCEAEELLAAACEKFTLRFARMEALARSQGQELDQLPLKEQDILWNAIKSARNGQI